MPEENIDQQVEKRVAKALADIEERSQKQLAATLVEVQNQRVSKAESHAVTVTRLLGLYTAIVTVLFLFVGFVGVKSTIDLRNFESQTKAIADAVADKKREVDDEAQRAEQELTALRTQEQTLRGELYGFEARFADVKLKSGLASTSPIILQTPTKAVGWMTFEGRNFGKTQGTLYAYIQEGATVSAAVAIEPSSIRGWSDVHLSVFLSETDLASLSKAQSEIENNFLGGSTLGASGLNSTIQLGARSTPFLCFQIVTADARSSEWSSPIAWR
jgi:hypothetical protein